MPPRTRHRRTPSHTKAVAAAAALWALVLTAQVAAGLEDRRAPPGQVSPQQAPLLTPQNDPTAFTKAAEETIDRICATCHGWDVIGGGRHATRDWDRILAEMVNAGAAASTEEMRLIRSYLLWSYGRVAVNTAPADELAAVLGISSDTAKAIVARRDERGAFDSVEALARVPGLDPAVLKAQADALVFERTASGSGS